VTVTASPTLSKAQRLYPWLLMVCLGLAAAALYLPGLGRVKASIWDEAYYLSTTARYAQGQAHFAAHPPLGTMLIAAGTLGLGDNDKVDWRPLGTERAAAENLIPQDFDWQGTRLLPALFGVAGVVLFAGLLLELTGSLVIAGLFGALWLFDTAIAVQVRSAQLDAFQLAFLLGALWSLARAWRTGSYRALFVFGALLTAATLVRANAAILGILWLHATGAASGGFVWLVVRVRSWPPG
jgi:dolichyl-phosphate-mannose--protein O-mannosyl transferase